MTSEEFQQIAQECTHFLPDHYPRSVRERMEDIAQSPYCEFRRDHYGHGGFVAELEKEIAELLGKGSCCLYAKRHYGSANCSENLG